MSDLQGYMIQELIDGSWRDRYRKLLTFEEAKEKLEWLTNDPYWIEKNSGVRIVSKHFYIKAVRTVIHPVNREASLSPEEVDILHNLILHDMHAGGVDLPDCKWDDHDNCVSCKLYDKIYQLWKENRDGDVSQDSNAVQASHGRPQEGPDDSW